MFQTLCSCTGMSAAPCLHDAATDSSECVLGCMQSIDSALRSLGVDALDLI